jgi:hypothetical protein
MVWTCIWERRGKCKTGKIKDIQEDHRAHGRLLVDGEGDKHGTT